MAEATHNLPETYEPSLFGTYSKKIGMWLFLLSDSLTFGALLYSYSYGRISIANCDCHGADSPGFSSSAWACCHR